ncbi:DUF2267 domain-containing protein [Streptomyces sp. NPDC005356]|uniref:DUF2267 domain-containing protein n=2 Tax=Streptomyces TaxID=1883 RepID=UPI0033BB3208
MSVDEIAHFGAQLPTLIRGIYYDSWRSSETPVKMDREELLTRVRQSSLQDRGEHRAAGAERPTGPQGPYQRRGVGGPQGPYAHVAVCRAAIATPARPPLAKPGGGGWLWPLEGVTCTIRAGPATGAGRRWRSRPPSAWSGGF